MKILIISPHAIPVPPFNGYGGTQRGIYDLCKYLSKKNHEVFLIASGSSKIRGKNTNLIGFQKSGLWEHMVENKEFEDTLTLDKDKMLKANRQENEVNKEYEDFILSKIEELKDKIDIINLRWERPRLIEEISKTEIPLVTSLHNFSESIKTITGKYKNTYFTAHTDAHKEKLGINRKNIHVVKYGIDSSRFQFYDAYLSKSVYDPKLSLLRKLKKENRDYMFSISKISQCKGQKTAIEIAKSTNTPLIIAGTPQARREKSWKDSYIYFKEEIEPEIDNELIYYFGSANEIEKNELMGLAKATVLPIGYEDKNWVEAFGRVVAESLASGTPCIVYKNSQGAAEQIIHGLNGFKFDNAEEVKKYLEKINMIDRTYCREFVKHNYDINQFGFQSESIFLLAYNNKNHTDFLSKNQSNSILQKLFKIK